MNAPLALPPFMQPLPGGVFQIDTGFHRDDFDAAYLMVEAGRAAFIDTGTNFAVPRLLQALSSLNLQPESVEWVIPTHVHLDHAGGVGLLMQHLPRAQVLVHPRGARHLVDPSALYQGALAVYGQQEMDRSYGRLVGVGADRVVSSSDGSAVSLAGRPLLTLDTPGHARHHHCIWDEATRGWFTGDTFGLSYREFDTAAGAWILPTSTPVQFEPEALQRSVERLLEREPDCMYLTHFGRVENVPGLGRQLLALLKETVRLGSALKSHPQRHAELKSSLLELYAQSLLSHGCPLSTDEIATLLAIDIELNAQGMAVWLDRA